MHEAARRAVAEQRSEGGGPPTHFGVQLGGVGRAAADATARAAGLSGATVLGTYAFRNAVLPVITTLGMVFSFTLGANVLVEKVFAWPGIGSYAVEALVVSDYAAVQGFVLSMAVLFVALNLVIDILYTLIDPRIQLDD